MRTKRRSTALLNDDVHLVITANVVLRVGALCHTMADRYSTYYKSLVRFDGQKSLAEWARWLACKEVGE